MKSLKSQECLVCGGDDRYCEKCVLEFAGNAQTLAKQTQNTLDIAAKLILFGIVFEFALSMLGYHFATSGSFFYGAMGGWWLGYMTKGIHRDLKSEKNKKPQEKLPPPIQCGGSITVVDVDRATGIGKSKDLNQRYSIGVNQQCNRTGAAACEQQFCTIHCSVICRDECPCKKANHEK